MTTNKTKRTKQPKRVPPTPEEVAANELREYRRRHIPIPPPHRLSKVGDRVSYGAHPNAEVLEVLDEGRLLRIKTWGEYQHYSNMIYQERTSIVMWVDVVPEVPNQKEIPSHILNDDIHLTYSQMVVSSLMCAYYGDGGIDMNPSYQRDYVWTDEDKVELIDSIFNNRPIGAHVLVWLPCGFEYHYEILDGKQRVRALCDFYEDRFKYKGKYFSELNYRDQCHFENFAFPRAEVRERGDKVMPLATKIRIFLHVNSCGRVMDKAHLEKVKAMLLTEEANEAM